MSNTIKTYRVVRKYMVIETYDDVKAFDKTEAKLIAAARRAEADRVERLHLSDEVYEETAE